jgi:5'-3' exonuclease
MTNIILVDSSYTSFHRFFATIQWFSLAHKEIFKEHKDEPGYDWMNEPLFFEKYKKMYLESIINLVSRKVFNESIVIFCLDSPQASLWRHEIGTCYKGNREDLSKKRNFKPTFNYTYNLLIPNLTKEYNNIHMIIRDKMEADDLIALIVRYVKHKAPHNHIYIVSGDNDFLQLGYDNLYFADYKKKDLIQLTKDEARETLLQKIINGDCSDNIPSIFPKELGISNKMKKLIRTDKTELKKYLHQYPVAKKQYGNNKKMISFKYIPKEYRPPVYKFIKNIL